MWDLLGSEIKPVFTALARGFFTPEPSEKPSFFIILKIHHKLILTPQKSVKDKNIPDTQDLIDINISSNVL